jgi:O-antigen ligase
MIQTDMGVPSKLLVTRQNARSSILPILLASVMILANSGNLLISTVNGLGDYAVLGIALLSAPFVLARWNKLDPVITLVFLVLPTIYAISLALDPSFYGIKHTALIFVVLIIFSFFFTHSEMFLKSPFFLAAVVASALIILLGHFTGPNKNTVAGAFAYTAFASSMVMNTIWFRSGWLLTLTPYVIVAALGFLLGDRAVAGLPILGIGMFFVVRVVAARRFIHTMIFAVSGAALAFFIAVFSQPDLVDLLYRFNAYVRQNTGRPAESGRQILWPDILHAVANNKWFGLGAGVIPQDIMNTVLSSHNLYLQVLLQTGIIGVSALVLLLFVLWRSASPDRRLGDLTFRHLLVVDIWILLLHCDLEVFLTQNSLVVGIPAWVMLGLGLGHLSAVKRQSVRQRLTQRPIIGTGSSLSYRADAVLPAASSAASAERGPLSR